MRCATLEMLVNHTKIAALVAMALLAGCRKPPPPVGGADGGPDGEIIDFGDPDGDGLCNVSEEELGANPSVRDTDADGFGDRLEAELGYDPTRPDSPALEAIAFLHETALSSARFVVSVPVWGSGQSYSGAFSSLARPDPDELDARSFYTRSLAFAALPRENVFDIIAEEERILGVTGMTELLYEVHFAYGAQPTRGCTRAYPWRYTVKRDDDAALVFSHGYLLVILPEGQELGTVESCIPAGPCL